MPLPSGRWERLADRPGGDVAGLASATADGGTLIFAATAVGVYRSVNGGRTWTLPASGSSVPFAEVVAPSPRFGVGSARLRRHGVRPVPHPQRRQILARGRDGR